MNPRRNRDHFRSNRLQRSLAVLGQIQEHLQEAVAIDLNRGQMFWNGAFNVYASLFTGWPEDDAQIRKHLVNIRCRRILIALSRVVFQFQGRDL